MGEIEITGKCFGHTLYAQTIHSYYVSGVAGSHLLYIIMTRLALHKRWLWRLVATSTDDASVGDL